MSLSFDVRSPSPTPAPPSPSSTPPTNNPPRSPFLKPTSLLSPQKHSVPAAELCETSDGFELLIELPGVRKENLSLTIENGLLLLKAQREVSLAGNPLIRESLSSDFFREFRLGSTVDTNGITALLEHGLLRLQIPKLPQSKVRHSPLTGPETN